MKFSNTKEKFSFLFKLLILAVCGVGLYLNFKIGPFNKMILYFTIFSNLMCFIFYLVAIILKLCNKLEKNNIYYIFKGMITMSITLTMLGYWFLIAPKGLGIYKNYIVACRFAHLYTPILMIFDYIIFAEKGNLNKKYSFIWSLILIEYIAFIYIYSSLGGRFINQLKYPYKFLDLKLNGIIKTIVICIGIYIIYVLIGRFVCYFDKRINERRKRKCKENI